jgi:hypothetical protein
LLLHLVLLRLALQQQQQQRWPLHTGLCIFQCRRWQALLQ